MEFRRTLFFSAMAHATIFIAALAFVGRDLVSIVPDEFISISLFDCLPDDREIVRHADQKGKAPSMAESRLPGVRKTKSFELPLAPPAAPDWNPPAAVGADATETLPGSAVPVIVENETKRSGLPGRDPGSSAGPQQASGPAKTRPQEFSAGTNTRNALRAIDPVTALRTAIEKAKSYPILARRRGMEGSVTVEFTVNAAGLPENLRVLRSSGFGLLDAAARETIVKAAPLPHVQGKIEVPVTYSLSEK